MTHSSHPPWYKVKMGIEGEPYLITTWTRSEVLVAQVEFFNAERTDLLLFILIDELVLLYPGHYVSDVWRKPSGGESGRIEFVVQVFEGVAQLRRAPVEIGGLINSRGEARIQMQKSRAGILREDGGRSWCWIGWQCCMFWCRCSCTVASTVTAIQSKASLISCLRLDSTSSLRLQYNCNCRITKFEDTPSNGPPIVSC